VRLCAFDVLALDGDDLRRLPLSIKANLARLLRGRPEGIFLGPFEQGEIGPDLFRKACEFGLGGLVSKHRDRPYRGGRQEHWIKTKKPEASSNEPRDGCAFVDRHAVSSSAWLGAQCRRFIAYTIDRNQRAKSAMIASARISSRGRPP
jgi:hypothetical protein